MAKKGSAIRHVKKFMDGKITPAELHRAVGVRKPCAYCGKPAAIRIRVLVQLKELTQRTPEFVAQIMATNPDGSWTVPTVATKYGPMVKISDIGACDLCRVEAEKAAARGPSWAIVEIDRRGLGQEDAVKVAVPDGIGVKETKPGNIIEIAGTVKGE